MPRFQAEPAYAHGTPPKTAVLLVNLGSPDAPTREEVFRRNNAAIASADIVIAYITAYDCIGTVWEIAFAQSRGIPVYILFHPDIDRLEFWYVSMLAEPSTAHLSRSVTEDQLPSAVERVIATWRARK